MRGNHQAADQGDPQEGSIPARAGEPKSTLPLAIFVRVYPRACGGTVFSVCVNSTPTGLSPRVRGNPAAVNIGKATTGSIPARAGEPELASLRPLFQRVYPRACGGTDQNR